MCTNHQSLTLSAEAYEKMKDLIDSMGITSTQIQNVPIQDASTQENVPTQIQSASAQKTFAEIIKEYGMTDEQVEFYKKYSMERSRKAYERVAAKELGSTELIKDWNYLGYYDAGFRGAEYCDAGHALRYVHIAHNSKTGKTLKFGIKCVTDFFKLTPAQIKFIKNGFNEANDEIRQGIDRFVEFNGDTEAYENKYHFQEKLNYILEHDANAFQLDRDDLVHLLKLGEIQYIFKLKLFLPRIWEGAINSTYRYIKRKEAKQQIQQRFFDDEEKNQLLVYLQQNHLNIYNIILSLVQNTHPSPKQTNFLDKLMSTPWKEVDNIIQQINAGKIQVKKGYLGNAYADIITCFHQYGLTQKQFNFLQKTLVK